MPQMSIQIQSILFFPTASTLGWVLVIFSSSLVCLYRPHHHPHVPRLKNPSVTQVLGFGMKLFALNLEFLVIV